MQRWRLLVEGLILGVMSCAGFIALMLTVLGSLGIDRRPAVVGLMADVLNIAGAVVLAYELLIREREHMQRKLLVAIVGRGIPVATSPRTIVKNQEELDRSFAQRSVRVAVLGSTILVIGFSILFYGRYLEYVDQGEVHRFMEKDRATQTR